MSLNLQLSRRITLDGLDPIIATRNLMKWINLGIGEDKNVALGHKSQVKFDKKNLVGYNIGIGYECLYYNSTGQYNTAIGYECFRGGSSSDGGTVDANLFQASSNVAIGYQCGQFIGGLHTDTNKIFVNGLNSYGQLGNGNTTNSTLLSSLSTEYSSITDISCGFSHSAFINDGKVYTFGRNNYGQLGDDTNTDRTSPILVPDHSSGFTNENIIFVECGYDHTILIKQEGSDKIRYVFGRNNYGQLGNNSTSNRDYPSKQDWGQTIFTKVACGQDHSITLLENGKAYSYGRNDYGQLGHGDVVTPHTHPTTGSQIGSYTDITHIACGQYHSAIIRSDGGGTLYTFGYNVNGQLGDGTTTNRSSPTLISGHTGIIDVKCGESFTIFLKSDGSLYSFGYNIDGQLGRALNYSTFLATEIPGKILSIPNISKFECGLDYTIVLTNDGLVYTFGSNNYSKLGFYDSIDRFYFPTQLTDLKNISLVGTGSNHILFYKSSSIITNTNSNNVMIGTECGTATIDNKYSAINNTYIGDNCGKVNIDGSFNIGIGYKCLFNNTSGNYNTILGTECLYSNIKNNYNTAIGYKCLYSNTADGNTSIGFECSYFNTTGYNNVSIGYHNFRGQSSYLESNNNTLIGYKCGEEVSGSCSNNIMIGYNCGTNITNANKNILVGDECGKFISKPTNKVIKSCGSNSFGGLGYGLTSAIEKNLKRVLLINETIKNNSFTITKIINGQYHTAILLSNKNLYLCGRNNEGQLGNGTTTDIYQPTLFTTYTDITDVACGTSHTIILRDNGTAYSFGLNTFGQLGHGNTTSPISTPTIVSGGYTDISKVFCGNNNTAIIRGTGASAKVWMFGENEDGELGDGTTTDRNSPTLVVNNGGSDNFTNDNIESVAVGSSHTLVLRSGVVFAFGKGDDGRLGLNSTTDYDEPKLVLNVTSGFTNTNVTHIAAGAGHSVVRRSDGKVYTFGNNFHGQLGDGTNVDKSVATEVSGDYTDVTNIQAGADHTVLLRSAESGSVYTFGRNNNGQLGDGTLYNRATPIKIQTNVDKISTNFNKLFVNSLIDDINNILIGSECGKGTQSNNFQGLNSTFIGNSVGRLNTTGSENNSIGNYSLFNNTTGNENISIGPYSLFNNNTGSRNIAFGNSSLFSNLTGQFNVSMGYQSLYSNTASYNTAIGYKCSYFNSTGQYNTALGYECLEGETNVYTGTNNNVAIGYQCGKYVGNGATNNVLIGFECAKAATSAGEFVGDNNTYIGYQCGLLNIGGSENVAIGTNCLDSNTTGSQNVAIGKECLKSNISGTNNVGMGYQSLFSNTTTIGNTAIGYKCLSNTGSLTSITLNDTNTYNVAIGTECSFQVIGQGNTAIGTQCLASDFTYSTITTTNDSMVIEPTNFNLKGKTQLFLTSTISDTIKLNSGTVHETGLAEINITENSTNLDTGNYSIKFDFKISEASPTENYIYLVIGNKIDTLIKNSNHYSNHWLFQKDGTDPKEVIFNGIVVMFKTVTTTDSILVYYDNNLTTRNIISEASTTGSINFGTNTFRSYTISYVSSTKILNVTDGTFTKTYNFNGITNINDNYITFGSSTHHNGTCSENYINNIKFSLSLVNSRSNTAVGYKNLYNNASGFSNSVIGYQSLYSNKSGYYNVSLGANSLYSNVSGYHNTAIGFQSGYKNHSGFNNITIGYNTSYNNRSGNNNIICGSNSNYKSEYNSNNIIYGNNNLYNAKGGYNTIVGNDNIYNSKYYIYGKTSTITSNTLVLDSETKESFTLNDNRYKIYIGWKICFLDGSGAGIVRTITDMTYSSPLYTITVDSVFPPFSEISYRYYKINITRPVDDGQYLSFAELALYDENDSLIIGAGTSHTAASATLTGTLQHSFGSHAGAFDNVITSTTGNIFHEGLSDSPAIGELQIDFGSGVTKKVGMYRIWARPGFHTDQAPKDWTFEASNDGSNWVILDRRAGVTTWPAVSGTNASSNLDKANEFRKIKNGSDPINYKLYFDLYNSIKNDMDIEFGYITASSNNTITLKRQSSLINDHYSNKRYYVKIVDSSTSSDIGQIRLISDYNSSTNIITVNSNWSSNPATNAKYRVFILLEFLHSYEVSGTSTQNSFGVTYYYGNRGQRYEGSDLLFIKTGNNTLSNYGKLNRITETDLGGGYGTTFHTISVEFPFETLPEAGDRVIFYDEKISEHNVLIGYKNSNNEIDGKYNIAIGNENLANNCNSIQNIVIGNFSLFNVNYSLNKIYDKTGYITYKNDDLSFGGFNIGLGLFSSFHNTIGKNNISLGTESLYNNQKGDNNIAIGYRSLKGLIGEKGSNSYPKGRFITPTANNQNDAFISKMYSGGADTGALNSTSSEFKYAGNSTSTTTSSSTIGGSNEYYIRLTNNSDYKGLFWNDKYRYYNNFPDTFLLEFDMFQGGGNTGGEGIRIMIGDKYVPPHAHSDDLGFITRGLGIQNGYSIWARPYYYPSADSPYSDHALYIEYHENNDISDAFPWGYNFRSDENTELKKSTILKLKKVEGDESSDKYYSHERGWDNDTWQNMKILFNRGEFTILKDNYILCKYIDEEYYSRNLSGATDRPYIWFLGTCGAAYNNQCIKNIKFSENISNLDVNPYNNVSALGPYAGNFDYSTLITTPIIDYDVFIGGGEGDDYQLIHANCNNTSRNWSPAVNNAVDLGTSTKAWKNAYIAGNVGIGTTDPVTPLQIQIDSSKDATDASNFDNYSLILSKVGGSSNGTEVGLCFDIQNSLYPATNRGPGAAITHERTDSYSKGKLHFKTKQTANEDENCVTSMTINEDGNVGIGTTSPTEKLEVNGTIKATGSKISGSIVQTAYKKYDKFITSNTGDWNDIDSNTSTGLVVSLTPSSANSKLLFRCTLHISVDNSDDSRWWGARLYRKIGSGSWAEVTGATNNQSSSRPSGTGVFMASHHQAGIDTFIQNLSNSYLDDANDNSNTHYYTIYWKCRLGSTAPNKTIHLNRADDSGDAYRALPISTLTLQEIYYP